MSELLEENPSGQTGADRYGEPVTTPEVNRPRRQSRRLTATVTDLGVGRQRAFLIGVQLPGVGMAEAERSLEELGLLTDTAGSDAIDRELVRRPVPDAAYLIGKGKASDLAAATNALDIDVVVVDAEQRVTSTKGDRVTKICERASQSRRSSSMLRSGHACSATASE